MAAKLEGRGGEEDDNGCAAQRGRAFMEGLILCALCSFNVCVFS